MLGNVTVVAPPTTDTGYASGPNAFGGLYQSADCKVAGVIANDGATFNVAGVKQGYQDILHNLAGLTTKGDLWPDGCTNPDANNPGSIAAYAGQASEQEICGSDNRQFKPGCDRHLPGDSARGQAARRARADNHHRAQHRSNRCGGSE